jgi:hypothetical protein
MASLEGVMENAVYTIRVVLKNGHDAEYQFANRAEHDRIWDAVQDQRPSGRFISFDTKTDTICINRSQIVFTHFLFDPAIFVNQDGEPSQDLLLYTTSRSDPYAFSIDQDADDLREDADAENAPLQHLLTMIDLSHEDGDIVDFDDGDGETVFVRLDEAALISVPHWATHYAVEGQEIRADNDDDAVEDAPAARRR